MALTESRQHVVSQARDCLNKNVFSTYRQDRPIPLNAIKAKNHVATDCSGAVIGIYYCAGAPDPGGNHYDGEGNTDSLFSHCEHINYENCLPGDLIDVVQGDGTTHVYLVLDRLAGGDMMLFSHGGPGPASSERLSNVKPYWYNRGYHFQGLRELAAEPQFVNKWNVLDGNNRHIAHTIHPAVWSGKHPRSFRKYGIVKFKHVKA